MRNYLIFAFLILISTNLFGQPGIEKYVYTLRADKSNELSNISVEFSTENGDICQVEFNNKGKIVVIKTIISLGNSSKKNASNFISFGNSSPTYQQLMKYTKKVKEEISKTGWYSRNISYDHYDYITIDLYDFKRLSTERKDKYLYVIVSKSNDYAYIIEPIELIFDNLSELLEHNDELYKQRIKLEEAKITYAIKQKLIADSIGRIETIKLQEYKESIERELRVQKLENERMLQERNSERLKVTSVITENLLYEIFITQSRWTKDPFCTYEENVNNSKKLIESHINTKYKLVINENQIREFYNAEYEEFDDRNQVILKFENSMYRINMCYGSINDMGITIPIPKEKARNLKTVEVIMTTTGIIYGGVFHGDKEFRAYEKRNEPEGFYGGQCLNFIIDSYILNYKDGTVEIIEK